MGLFSAIGNALTNRYFAALFLVGVGVAVGLVVFFYAFPGKPKIGVIDIPFTVISEDTTFVITEYLSYARRDDSIKAVVIKLTSPGGGAAASERLYLETKRLREEKPVVLVMNGLVASGGYMMSMGVNHTFAQTSSLVGSVGVVSFNDPLIPPLPGESVLSTGPYKLAGFDRQEWFGTVEELKESFAHIVITERGDKLRISKDELTKARIYSGLQGVQLGLVDEFGGDSEAFAKAAELAGVSNYGLVDVNLEVLKEFFKELEDILGSARNPEVSADSRAILGPGGAGYDPASQLAGFEAGGSESSFAALQRLAMYGRLGIEQEDPLPDLPMELNHPNFYYLYVGNAQ